MAKHISSPCYLAFIVLFLWVPLLLPFASALSEPKEAVGPAGESVVMGLVCGVSASESAVSDSDSAVSVSLGGNSYAIPPSPGVRITDEGVTRWSDKDTRIALFFRVNRAGSISLALRARSNEGSSKLLVEAADKRFMVSVASAEYSVIPLGTITIHEPGYVRVDILAMEKSGREFAEISDLVVSGEGVSVPMNYVHDFASYWGRRGPSVHLRYALPETAKTEWFYNEVTVPEGNDVEGSYYMANGFGEGYFGIQVNSPTQRRVLFSVWSPFDTQDPKLIPDSMKIHLLKRGEGVYVGEFGNEGSGGQSYLVYPWKSGVTYKFLTRILPDGKGSTQYTAWFYATDEGRWRLIASFLRPQTNTWYTSPYSFLENFNPSFGYITRRVLFSNQWARDSKGMWHELTQARFSYDATARAQVRVDYAGGEENGGYFLQNCGFFNDNTPTGAGFTRPGGGTSPEAYLKAVLAVERATPGS